jgi:two-component system sensor histidine kinase/response regulator
MGQDMKSISTNGKVLAVDDSRSVLIFIREILEKYYTVRTASSGEEALDKLRDYKPDVMLLDVNMPGMDGYTVCKKVKSENRFGFVKIVMVSSETGLRERLKGYEAGVDDYMGKPFEEEELLAKVRVFLRLKAVEDELFELNNSLNDQVRIRTRQLIESEKMAAIGKWTAGIVHNLNNPLQAILGYSQMLEMEHPEISSISFINEAAMHMKKMIATILVTGAMESSEMAVDIDLNAIIRGQIELLKANQFFKHKVKTELDLRPLPLLKGIYSHFSQSLGNLIKNAVDAMYESEKKDLSISTSSRSGVVRILIRDTGCGISEENMGRIFEPFFTTKPLMVNSDRPSGTGLGLASSKEMIESYGGKILADSEIGKGAVFTVLLPLNG